jgi:hypothetical protein
MDTGRHGRILPAGFKPTSVDKTRAANAPDAIAPGRLPVSASCLKPSLGRIAWLPVPKKKTGILGGMPWMPVRCVELAENARLGV